MVLIHDPGLHELRHLAGSEMLRGLLEMQVQHGIQAEHHFLLQQRRGCAGLEFTLRSRQQPQFRVDCLEENRNSATCTLFWGCFSSLSSTLMSGSTRVQIQISPKGTVARITRGLHAAHTFWNSSFQSHAFYLLFSLGPYTS